MNPLALYLSGVLAVVAPQLGESRRASVATDVAAVVLTEERAFDDDEDGQRTALLLLAIAHYESHWAKWVDDGSCNDPVWREAHPTWMKGGSGCDGGKAWGMWQVHAPDDDVVIGRSYVTDRKVGIRAALAKARASLKDGRRLCGYVGEVFPRCRQADLRLDTARNWVTVYPYRPELLVAGDHTATAIE